MEKPRTEKLLDLLKKSPDGLNMDQLVKLLKVKAKRDVGNTIQLLKHNGYNIVSKDGIYILDSENKLPKNNTALDKLIDLLLKYPDGITPIELAKICNIKKNALSNRIFYIRKRGHNVVFKNDRYCLLPSTIKSPVIRETTTTKETPATRETKALIPNQFRDTFKSLSDNDKADCIDMLRKSLYYYKSALSLLESNKEVFAYVSLIEGRS